jgi:hypothetical protein
MCSYLFDRAMEGTGKRYFLEKTPRNFYVFRELITVFPEARYVVLRRNPLAVFASYISTYVSSNLTLLGRFKTDLLEGPGLLNAGVAALGDKAILVRYEDLVVNPEDQLERIWHELEIDPIEGLSEYGRNNLPVWRDGDRKGVYRHQRPDAAWGERWLDDVAKNPQRWRLMTDYLEMLNPTVLEEMGYPYAELRATLDARAPSRDQLRRTLPLSWLWNAAPDARPKAVRLGLQIYGSLWDRGIRGTIAHVRERQTAT